MRLRQIALVGADLEQAEADIRAVLGLDYAYDDPGVGKFGLRNAVFPVGETFLEVVSPRGNGTTAGRLLEKRGGDGGYMVILQVHDIKKARSGIAAAHARVVEDIDLPRAKAAHIHPKDVGGAILSLDWMDGWDHWEWGGPDWRDGVRTDVSTSIVGAEIQGADPDAMSDRWSEVLGRPRMRSQHGWRIPLEEDGQLRFVTATDGRGDGLRAFDVRVHNPAAVYAVAEARGLIRDGEVTLCGTVVNLLKV